VIVSRGCALPRLRFAFRKAQIGKAIRLCLFVPFLLKAAPSEKTVWSGVYTESQAQLGKTAYTRYCERCHKPDLMGIEGAMKGEPFMERRREDTLETLFLDMKATMPRGNPGGLPDQTYADIISYILQSNEMPAGSVELKPEAVVQIDVVGKDGPQPVPNFAAVLSVGCLVQNTDKRWMLTNATEPVRTRDAFKQIEKELTASAQRPLGEISFRLADPEDFGAASHVGKKVQVKGILVRAPAGNRINVNSIEPLAESCM
jgi:Cytochrome C oxidase, cbb3-type, subunit III